MLVKIIILAGVVAAVASASASSISVRATNDYYFSSQQVSYTQAWAYCKNANLNFVSLPTAAQNDALAKALDALGASSTTFWIGGIYLRNGFLNKWYWVDGQEDFNYLNWISTPSLSTSIDYCTIYSYSATTKTGKWTYGNCTTAKYFICQY